MECLSGSSEDDPPPNRQINRTPFSFNQYGIRLSNSHRATFKGVGLATNDERDVRFPLNSLRSRFNDQVKESSIILFQVFTDFYNRLLLRLYKGYMMSKFVNHTCIETDKLFENLLQRKESMPQRFVSNLYELATSRCLPWCEIRNSIKINVSRIYSSHYYLLIFFSS